jgi:hypothetical protein
MKAGGCQTQDAAGFIVLSGSGHVAERGLTGGAFQQESVFLACENAGRTVSAPPFHDRAAEALIFLKRELEHGGFAVP